MRTGVICPTPYACFVLFNLVYYLASHQEGKVPVMVPGDRFFADHWGTCHHAHPRYQTAYYDGPLTARLLHQYLTPQKQSAS